MTPLAFAVPFRIDALMTASLRLTLFACVVWLCLRFCFPTKSPGHHRWLWAAVLLQGLIVFPAVLPVAILTPQPTTSAAAASDALPNVALTESPNTSQPANSATSVVRPLPIPWRSMLFGLWSVGLVGIAGTLAAAQLLVWLKLRQSVRARDAWCRELEQVCQELRIDEQVQLSVHANMGPLLAWQPRLSNVLPRFIRRILPIRIRPNYTILIPQAIWSNLPKVEREAILVHELAHLQRGDLWKSLGMRVAASLHWFNPLAWWSVRRFDEAAEWACDGKVSQLGAKHATALASALLKLTKPSPLIRLCVSSARGASLSVRVRRLLEDQKPREPFMKRLAIAVLVVGILALGAIRVQLVAQESDPAPGTRLDLPSLVTQLIGDLDTSDPLTKKLGSALETPAGQLLLRDGLGNRAAESLESIDPVAAILDEHFDRKATPPVLRTDSVEFGQRLIQAGQHSQKAMAGVEQACREIAERLAGEDEETLLIKRFLNSDSGPVFLYINVLREHMHPSPAMFRDSIGRSLARNEKDGRYYIRQDMREPLSTITEQLDAALQQQKELELALREWAVELEPDVELHDRVRRATEQSTFAALHIAQQLFERKELDPRMTQNMLDQLDSAAIDTSRGLKIRGEIADELSRILDEYEAALERLSVTQPALIELSKDLADVDELHLALKRLMNTDIGTIAVAMSSQMAGMSPTELILEIIGGALDGKSADGPLRLTSDPDVRKEITENIQSAFREMRIAKRRAAPLRVLAAELEDQELAESLRSAGGLLVVKQQVEQLKANSELAAFESWQEELFERTDHQQLKVRSSMHDMVQTMLTKVDELSKEISNDDF